MFDAYFSPPFLQPIDAHHMQRYGVTECVLAIPTAHCKTSVRPKALAHMRPANHPHASPRVRQLYARKQLEEAGIRVRVADAISAHLEPERNWEAQWNNLASRVERGDVTVLGVMSFDNDHGRAFDILDRHLVLSKQANLPIYVRPPALMSRQGHSALLARARAHQWRWYWVHPCLAFAHRALMRGEGVILAPHRRMPATDIARLFATLTPKERLRLIVGSSHGRGLNPFALASVEIAMAEQQQMDTAQQLLHGGALAMHTHKSSVSTWVSSA